jgi:hypothetical protein
MYRDMATIGVDIVSWQTGRSLEQSMNLLPDRRHRARVRVRG